jgi:membrane protease YdiL (CAAX protease family)
MKRADWRQVHALILTASLAAAVCIPALCIWPWPWVVPLVGYAGIVALVPPLRRTFPRWRFGRVSKTGVIATALIAAGSSAVLLAFQQYARPDTGGIGGYLPFVFLQRILGAMAAAYLFSGLNAFFEEMIFRGIFFDALKPSWGSFAAILVTAFFFGYGHLRGYPPGPLGAVLAGLFGLCLGWLRFFTRGIGLPFLAHMVADLTIFRILTTSGP